MRKPGLPVLSSCARSTKRPATSNPAAGVGFHSTVPFTSTGGVSSGSTSGWTTLVASSQAPSASYTS